MAASRRIRARATRHLPSARQRAHVGVHHFLREAQAGEDFSGPRVEPVAAELIVAGLHMTEPFDGPGVELVGTVRIRKRHFELGLARQQLRTRALRRPKVWATAERPFISPTS